MSVYKLARHINLASYLLSLAKKKEQKLIQMLTDYGRGHWRKKVINWGVLLCVMYTAI